MSDNALEKKAKQLEQEKAALEKKNAELAAQNKALAAAQAKEEAIPTDPNEYLSDTVREKYEVVNWTGGYKQVFGSHGVINLKTITSKRVAVLIAKGFQKFKAK